MNCLVMMNGFFRCSRTAPMAVLLALINAHAGPYLELSPMVGHMGPGTANLWIKSSGPGECGVRIGTQPDLSDARTIAGPTLNADADFMGTVSVSGLNPGTRYYYAVQLEGEPVMSPPFPSFETAPKEGEKGRVRFAFVSCLGRNGFDAAAAWGDMAERVEFDLLLMLGDNHYADSTAAEAQRAAYYNHRRVAGYREIAARTPVYAIWDDHDYGPNDSDRTAEGKEDSLRTFKEFWANPSYGETDNPGVYYRFSRGDVDFIMLDCRYYRSPNRAPDDGNKTALGSRQLEWLKRQLLDSRAALKFIASGSEWQSHGHPDSWTSFDRERNEIWQFIKDHEIQGVIFLSGDRHFTGAYQIQGRFIEVTSGPLGSTNYPTRHLPEMFINHGEGKLYSIFDVDTAAAVPEVVLEIYRAGEGLVEKRRLTWEEINGEAKIEPLPQEEASGEGDPP